MSMRESAVAARYKKVCRWARKAVAGREKLSLHEKSCRCARKAVAAREKLSLHEKSCRCTRKAVAAREKLSLREKSFRCAHNLAHCGRVIDRPYNCRHQSSCSSLRGGRPVPTVSSVNTD